MQYVTALKPSNAPVWIFCNDLYTNAITDKNTLISNLRGYAYCGVNGRTVRTAKVRDTTNFTFLPFYFSTDNVTFNNIVDGSSILEYMPNVIDPYLRGRPYSAHAVMISTRSGVGAVDDGYTSEVSMPVPVYKTVQDSYSVKLDLSGRLYRCMLTASYVSNKVEYNAGTDKGVGVGIKLASYESSNRCISKNKPVSGYDVVYSMNTNPAPDSNYRDYCRVVTREEASGAPVYDSIDLLVKIPVTFNYSGWTPKTEQPILEAIQVIGNSIFKFEPSCVAITEIGANQIDLKVELPTRKEQVEI